MTGLKIAVALSELAIFYDAATDTGREGEIKGATFAMVGLGESGEIGVVFNVDGEAEIIVEFGGDIKIVPVEVAKPSGNVAFDDAGHRDGARFNAGNTEVNADLLAEVLVKLALVLEGSEFNGMKDFTIGIN